MNEEELNAFLNKIELQLEKKILEEYENYENKLINQLEEMGNSETYILNNDNKEKSFIGKRKRASEEIFEISAENEEKNIKIQNNQEKIKDNNINIDKNKDNNININKNLDNNNISNNEIKVSKNECNNNKILTIDNKNINNDNNLYNYEDEDKSQFPINCIESRPNMNNDIFEKIDYHYQPSYKFLENNSLYRTDSLGNFLIVDNNPFNFDNEQKDNLNNGIKFCNEDNFSFFENR